MTEAAVNRLKNGDFSAGKRAVVGWEWVEVAGASRWRFEEGQIGTGGRAASGTRAASGGRRCLCVELGEAGSAVGMRQRVSCRPEKLYRIELAGRCDDGVRVGVRLSWAGSGGRLGEGVWWPAVGRDGRRRVWREYCRSPEGANEIEVQVGFCGGPGRCRLDEVGLIGVDEPEESCHVLAFVPPPLAYPPPMRTKRVMVCGQGCEAAGMAELLGERLGRRRVRHVVNGPRGGVKEGEAMIVVGQERGGPSLVELRRWGERGLVIVSLEVFEQAVNGHRPGLVRTRMVRQQEGEPCGRVDWANFITRGFALKDVVPYWWDHEGDGCFYQRQIRGSGQLDKFLEGEGFVTVLRSEDEYDETSDQPLVLYRGGGGGAGGGLVVMDVSAAAGAGSNLGQNELPLLLLLNALGQERVELGQYVVPVAGRSAAAELVWELGKRFVEVELTGSSDRPIARVGGASMGRQRCEVLLRTCFDPGGWVGFYSVLLWLRSLGRDLQMGRTWGRALTDRVTLTWDALASDGEGPVGGGGAFDVVIDVECGAEAAVAVHRGPKIWDRWWRSLGGRGPGLCWLSAEDLAGDGGASHVDGSWVTLTLPGAGLNSLHRSVELTELGAALVERLVGLQFGLMAANRTSAVRKVAIGRAAGLSGRFELLGEDGAVVRAGRLSGGGLDEVVRGGWTLMVDRRR